MSSVVGASAVPARAAETPGWVIDPLIAQSDLPPVGRSAFDQLTADKGAHRLPFPFADLLKRIALHAGVDALGRPGIKRVLIPLGRSLQRGAAAPQFFRFPRVVVAVDGEPHGTAVPALLLKDRLYIGYQEKAAVLEVISYNEEAGRFEFQIVKNYRAGARPEVFYANRAVCISCHQNHAPIFSRQQWDETNANPVVAAALAARATTYQDTLVRHGVDQAYAIDNATDRSNLFSAWQRLWREGCGPQAPEAAVRCRAAAFVAMLQSRLSGGPFDRKRASYRDYAVRLAQQWQHRWPQGLSIADPDLANRKVLHTDAQALEPPVAIPAAFDPLALRAPLEQWSHTRAEDLDRLVGGLGEFVSAGDVAALDRLLKRSGRAATVQRREALCAAAERKPIGSGRWRLVVRCPASGAAGSLALRAKLYFDRTRVTAGTIENLSIEQDDSLPALAVHRGRIASGFARFSVRNADGHARTARGDHIEQVSLDWSQKPPRATVTWREDFALVDAAVRRMVERNDAAFADAPIRRSALLGALYREIDPSMTAASLVGYERLPPAKVERSAEVRNALPSSASPERLDLTAFYRACGTCHDTPEPSPPNFLHGDAARAESRIKQCAPRIRARLAMWQVQSSRRAKTPMPPPLGLQLLDTTSEAWVKSDELQRLSQQIDRMLAHRPLIRNADAEYEALPPCLSATDTTRDPAMPRTDPEESRYAQ